MFAGDPPKAWTLWFGDLVEQFSWANLAVYALTAAVCLHILYRRGRISLREGIQQAGSYTTAPVSDTAHASGR